MMFHNRAMIIWGSITAVFGILLFFFLPDQPKSRWFRLSFTQEKIVEERVLDNAVVRNRNVKSDQIIEALKEPRLYACFFISLLLNIQSGALQTFTSQIIHRMGFSVIRRHVLITHHYSHCLCCLLALDNCCYEHSYCRISDHANGHRYPYKSLVE